ncbi:cytochrome P450 [Actinoallomurus sp. NPDC052308]|uniref:cytochrome P450 n=1 Tax=Actinoallomurus sp. NPDC052308 TaxID=3155530 RepID=UPI00342209F5
MPRPRDAKTISSFRFLPALLRDPVQATDEVGRISDGDIVRLGVVGPFRPYLVTHPDHVQHVLRDHADNYRREGLLWKPLSRLVGEPSGADPAWALKKGAYQAMFSGPNIASFTDDVARAIVEAVDELAGRAVGRPVDAADEMTRLVYRAITRVIVGDKMPLDQIDELGRVLATATTSSFRSRMLLPFVPFWVPLPGDRAFRRAVQAVDDLIFPIVRDSRRRGADGGDIVSRLIRARDENGNGLDEQNIRDGVVALFVAATETSVSILSFLWMVLDSRPDIAAKLYAEIDRVVGTDHPRRAHLSELRYAKMVTQEVLRLYSPGWIIPRTVVADDVIDGVRIRKGSILVISPYLTHRLADVWPDPRVFDPERFAPGQSRHRFAFLTFSGGPHQCVGSYFFTIEAQLIMAAMLSRFEPVIHGSPSIEPRLGLTLKPSERIQFLLRPRGRVTSNV